MIRKIYFIILLGFMLIWACDNPLEGFALRFKEPIDKAKLDIRVYNTNGALPTGLRVRFGGVDSSLVVTNLNTKKFKLSAEGVMIVAVNPEVIPSTENPIKFSVIVEAPGYTKVVRSLVYTSQANKSLSIPLFSESTAPTGVSATEWEGLNFKANQTFSSLIVGRSTSNQITLAAETIVKDAWQSIVTGTWSLVAHYFDARARGYLPAGGVATNAIDVQGKALNDPFDLPNLAGFVYLEMANELGQTAKTLSKSLYYSMDLSNITQNPQTGKALAVGDIIPIISYDTDTGQWKLFQTYKVEKNTSTGALFVRFEVNTLGYWIAGWPRTICSKGPTFVFKSQLKNVDLVYYCQLIDAQTQKVFREYYLNINDGARFTVTYIPMEVQQVQLKVTALNNYTGGDKTQILGTSATVGLCEDKTLNIDLSKFSTPPAISASFNVVCPVGKTVDLAALPALFRIQISAVGANTWKDLVTLTRTSTSASTYRLLKNVRYDFRASTDGGVTWPYKENSKLIDQSTISYKIEDKSFCK